MSLTPLVLAEISRIGAEIDRLEAQRAVLVRLLANSTAIHAVEQPVPTRVVEPLSPPAPKQRGGPKNGWTEAEDALLREHYPNGGAVACEPFLPGRSAQGIKIRAGKLGLKCGRGKGARRPRGPAPAPISNGCKSFPARPESEPRSFEEQLAMVERGEARLVEKFVPPPVDLGFTAGGVVGEIL